MFQLRDIRYLSILTIVCWSVTAQADADSDLRNTVSNQVVNAWKKNDLETLELLEKKYLNPKETTISGKRLLAVYDKALSALIYPRSPEEARNILLITSEKDKSASLKEQSPVKQEEESRIRRYGPDTYDYPEKEKEWDAIEAKLNLWRSLYPHSPNPIIALAHFYENKAWYFRGNQIAKNVNKFAWPVFFSNLNKEKTLLSDTKDLSQKNPIWFKQMLAVLGAVSAPKEQLIKTIAETVSKGQGYPMALYEALNYMQPRWGGTYEEMTAFIDLANKKTLDTSHGEMYARLYWNFVSYSPDEMDASFFIRTGADWPSIEKSFQIMIREHPAARNYEGYALFACMANEPEKSKSLLLKAGAEQYTDFWPSDLKMLCTP